MPSQRDLPHDPHRWVSAEAPKVSITAQGGQDEADLLTGTGDSIPPSGTKGFNHGTLTCLWLWCLS